MTQIKILYPGSVVHTIHAKQLRTSYLSENTRLLSDHPNESKLQLASADLFVPETRTNASNFYHFV